MTYDKAYFIAKFEAIPEDKWTTGTFFDGSRCCALGHCGWRFNKDAELSSEGYALSDLFENGVDNINDKIDSRYQQPTPKQRILAALKDLP